MGWMNIFMKRVMGLALLATGLALYSCSDDVDDSDLYSFQGQTVGSYLESSDDYSKFYYLLERTKLSKKSSSTLATLLKTRGHFTVFAPTNDAVQAFLDSAYMEQNYDITLTPDSMVEYITRNAVINNGDREAYQTSDFVVGALEQTNMEDRYIMIDYDTINNGKAAIIVNSYSVITQPNIEVENGEIHGIDRVLQLSRATLPALIEEAPNLKIFSQLLNLTGWADSMKNVRDEDYEENHSEYGPDLDGTSQALNPEHRYYGFTVFVETDSVFHSSNWGIPEPILSENGQISNWDDIWTIFQQRCKEAYPNATDPDPKSPDNAVNQFVSYHIVPARMSWDKLIIHYLEMGYAYKNPNSLSINCHEYYETIGKHHRLLKLTEGKTTDGKRINRCCTYDYTDYSELFVEIPGIKIQYSNGKAITNSLNGFYYPIDKVLVYDSDVRNRVLNERLRWDFSSLFSELITNGLRRISDAKHYPIPHGYFERLTCTDDSRIVYLPYYGASSQGNYQADEFNIRGMYDFTFRLPPVPNDGTYELRICAPCNPTFGMAQFYFGTDKDNLSAVGLPVDLRVDQGGSVVGWEADTGDEEHDNENDKVMRNHGYMKPPMHDGISTNGSVVTEPMRNSTTYRSRLRLRKILWTGSAKNSETYYIRCKSLLKNTQACFLLDYMEWVPKNVYNGTDAEDKW